MERDDPRAVYVVQWLAKSLPYLTSVAESAIVLRQAVRCGERLAAADPGNAEWQRDLSVSHNMIGYVLGTQGDQGAVPRPSFRAGLDISQRLAAADPGNAEWQRDLSVSHNKIGDVLSTQGDQSAVLASFRASLDISERPGRRRPGQRRVATRPVGKPYQDRRRAQYPRRSERGARVLPGQSRHQPTAGRRRSGQRRLATRPVRKP